MAIDTASLAKDLIQTSRCFFERARQKSISTDFKINLQMLMISRLYN